MRRLVSLHRTVKLLSVASLVVMIGGCNNSQVRQATGQEADEEMGAVERPPVIVTVSNGRSVQVDESDFTESGLHGGPATNLVGNRARLMVGEPGQEMTIVTMKADSLMFIHVDASVPNDNTILVYGSYDPEIPGLLEAYSPTSKAALFSLESTEATKAGWECIWCRGGILACGVEPQCGR